MSNTRQAPRGNTKPTTPATPTTPTTPTKPTPPPTPRPPPTPTPPAALVTTVAAPIVTQAPFTANASLPPPCVACGARYDTVTWQPLELTSSSVRVAKHAGLRGLLLCRDCLRLSKQRPLVMSGSGEDGKDRLPMPNEEDTRRG